MPYVGCSVSSKIYPLKYDKFGKISYGYAKNFKIPRNFPNDAASIATKERIFKANGNGWWVKYRVDDIHIPKYWVVSTKFKLNGTWQT